MLVAFFLHIFYDWGVADKIAEIPSTAVTDAANAQEQALILNQLYNVEQRQKKENENGMSDFEKTNVDIMNGLQQKYPDAFRVEHDEKGREALIFGYGHSGGKYLPDNQLDVGIQVISQYGFADVSEDKPDGHVCRQDFDLTKVLSRLRYIGYTSKLK
jgi:hypothetical protein